MENQPIPLLEVQNLTTVFKTEEGNFNAVKSINFELFKGQTLGIVGESGSGKSVTSLSILKLLGKNGFFAEGSIFFYDKDKKIALNELSDKAMNSYRGARIAMIFQEPMTALNPVLTCGEQVAEALRHHLKLSQSDAYQRVIILFEKVKLPNPARIYKSYPHQISGGQKQRVMIAMALSCNPDLLIADEPTTALDVTVQKSILELIKELQKEIGIAVMFISHDLGLVRYMADSVLVMYRGNIVEAAKTEDIFKNPNHPYTKSLMACRPPLDMRLKRLPVVSDFMETEILNDGTVSLTEKKVEIDALRNKWLIKPEERKSHQLYLNEQNKILEVNDLNVWFPSQKNWWGKTTDYVKAVKDVNFYVREGETLGLVGESGCGKSTLGRAILGLIKPNSGKIIFDGQEITGEGTANWKHLRKQIQLIFQDPYSSLNPRMTIGNAVMEPMIVHKIYDSKSECKSKTIDLLKTVGLEEKHFNRYPHEFSGGQRQRVCIARALSVNPRFIVCDECVSALDVSVQAQVLNLLCDLREQFKLTYIFISHDLGVVKFMSDRLLVMQSGAIVEQGDADEVYANPQEEYTRQLIGAIIEN